MKKLLITGIFTLLSSLLCLPQAVSFKLLKCADTSGTRIVNDNLGNIYILDKSSLKKFDANGLFLCSHSELADGLISAIDVSDPLKIIILNADFGKIKFLDNKLNVKNTPVLLSHLGYNNATLVASSYESGFWIFDPLSNQLVRFDNNLQISQTSGNISDLIGSGLQPVFMLENDNILYLNDPLVGILMFDRYGTYLKTIPVKNISSFQIFNNSIFYTENNTLKSIDIKTYEEKIMKLPLLDEEIIGAAISSTKLSLITKTKFCTFVINNK
jgi:hypothetical protein